MTATTHSQLAATVVVNAVGESDDRHAMRIHVAGGHPSADDQNPGTAALPMRTIAAAVERWRPGQRVVIHPGVYREAIRVRQSGTTESPLVIEALKPGTVVVSGCDVFDGWQPCDLHESAFELRDYGSPLPTTERYGVLASMPEMVFVDGQPLRPVRHADQLIGGTFWLDRDGRRLVIVPQPFTGELTAGDANASTGFLTGGDRSSYARDTPDGRWPFLLKRFVPREHVIEVTTRACLFEAGHRAAGRRVDHLVLRGIIFRGAGTLPQRGAAIFYGSHHTLEDCVFEYNAASGFEFRVDHGTVRRCVSQYNGQLGLGGAGNHTVVEDCRLAYNNWKHSKFGCFENGGCKIVKSTDWTFRRCTVVGNDGPGIWFDIDNRNCVVAHCRVSHNSGPGIMYEISYDALIHDNVVVGNGRLTWVNGWFDTERPAMGVADRTYGQGILIQFSAGCRVLHNTCVDNQRCGIELRHHPYQQGATEQMPEKYRLRDTIVLNNALVDNAGSAIIASPRPALPGKQDEVGPYHIDHNLYHESASLRELEGDLLRYARWGKTFDAASRSLEEWRVYAGTDLHSIQWDPRFVSAGEGDYRPGPGSPLIGRGTRACAAPPDSSRPFALRDTIGASGPAHALSDYEEAFGH